MVKLLKTTGEEAVIDVINQPLTLKFMQQTVGGLIQIVPLNRIVNGSRITEAVLIMNEEGKLQDLPLNLKATEIWEGYYGHSDLVCGNVFFLTGEEYAKMD